MSEYSKALTEYLTTTVESIREEVENEYDTNGGLHNDAVTTAERPS